MKRGKIKVGGVVVDHVMLEDPKARAAEHRYMRFKQQLITLRPPHLSQDDPAIYLERIRPWLEKEVRKGVVNDAILAKVKLAGPGVPWTDHGFEAFVERVNQETFKAEGITIRLGWSSASRLAQCNHRTRVLTFSRYAVRGMPLAALRYLVIHELAHLYQNNHSRRFWALVARHDPNWREHRAAAAWFFGYATKDL